MGNPLLKRHTGAAIFMHWFNALCWLFLLATGLGLVANDSLSPLGSWWPSAMVALFGKGEYLLVAHEACGVIWAAGFLLYAAASPRRHLFRFLREIFSISFSRDLLWLAKKGVLMTLGKAPLKKRGIDPELPEQGFYNVGQKLFAVPSLIGGILIAATGVIMMLSKVIIDDPAIVQWAILVHFITAGAVFAGLLIHIYMAAIVPEERPAFISMFTGTVPADFAKHHNGLWYRKLKREEEEA